MINTLNSKEHFFINITKKQLCIFISLTRNSLPGPFFQQAYIDKDHEQNDNTQDKILPAGVDQIHIHNIYDHSMLTGSLYHIPMRLSTVSRNFQSCRKSPASEMEPKKSEKNASRSEGVKKKK